VGRRLEQWARPVVRPGRPTVVLQLDPPDRGDAWFLSVLVGVGVDNAVWHKAYHGGTNWDAAYEPILGAVLNGTGPVITSKGVDHLNVYVTGADNRVWHNGYAAGWSGWTNLGGTTNDSPGATHTTGDYAYVSARLVAWDNSSAGIWTKRW